MRRWWSGGAGADGWNGWRRVVGSVSTAKDFHFPHPARCHPSTKKHTDSHDAQNAGNRLILAPQQDPRENEKRAQNHGEKTLFWGAIDYSLQLICPGGEISSRRLTCASAADALRPLGDARLANRLATHGADAMCGAVWMIVTVHGAWWMPDTLNSAGRRSGGTGAGGWNGWNGRRRVCGSVWRGTRFLFEKRSN